MNYCQDGLQVYFVTETQQYFDVKIYGHYDLQPNYVNGRPWFKKGGLGLWSDGKYWFIGSVSDIGQPFGTANNQKDVFCPHQLSELNWILWDGGTVGTWYDAENDLGITCK